MNKVFSILTNLFSFFGMAKEKSEVVATATIGEGSLLAIGAAADAANVNDLPVGAVVQAVTQIVIAVVTLWKLFKAGKKNSGTNVPE